MVFSQRQVPHTALPKSLHSSWSVETSAERGADVVRKTRRGAKAAMCTDTHTHLYSLKRSSVSSVTAIQQEPARRPAV